MSERKSNVMTFFCSIPSYLEQNYPKLLELLKNTCTVGSLSPKGPVPGITLLIPDDATMAKIEKLANSSVREEYNSASEILSACILRNVFKDASDFSKADKEGIPNCQYPSRLLTVSSASGNSVTFEIAKGKTITATPDTKFKDGTRKSKLAVWKLSGEMTPLDGPLAPMRKFERPSMPKPKGKTGSYEMSQEQIQNASLRWKIGVLVENAFAQELMLGPSSSTNSMLLSAYSLACYVHSKNPELFYNRVLPCMGMSEADFYILVEPHRFSGQPLIEDNLIEDWWKTSDPNVTLDVLNANLNQFKDQKRLPKNICAIYDDPRSVAEVISNIRPSIPATGQIVSAIAAFYNSLSTNNKLNTVSGILPDDLASRYASEPNLKIREDEMRFFLHMSLLNLRKAPVITTGAFNEIVQRVGDYMYVSGSSTGNLIILNESRATMGSMNDNQFIEVASAFVNSSAFLSLSIQTGKPVDTPSQAGGNKVYNLGLATAKTHERLLDTSQKLREALKAVSLGTISGDLRVQLENLLKNPPA